MPRLRVAALLAGEPGPLELWTLRGIASAPCHMTVLPAKPLFPGLIAACLARKDRPLLAELFDEGELRAWWRGSGIQAMPQETVPDVIVRVSGDAAAPGLLPRVRLGGLSIHHGSIPLGIARNRPDWIGASIVRMGRSLDDAAILWRGAPQLAPGDTDALLLFRAHLEAVAALGLLLEDFALEREPKPLAPAPSEASNPRGATRLRDWLRLLRLDRGRGAPALLERALEC